MKIIETHGLIAKRYGGVEKLATQIRINKLNGKKFVPGRLIK